MPGTFQSRHRGPLGARVRPQLAASPPGASPARKASWRAAPPARRLGRPQVARDYDESKTVVVLFPDTGRELPLEALQRLVAVAIRDARPTGRLSCRGGPRRQGGRPPVVTIRAHDKVRQAVDLLQRHSISQAPVVRHDDPDLTDFVGSIRERELLDRVFRDPDALQADVAEAMDRRSRSSSPTIRSRLRSPSSSTARRCSSPRTARSSACSTAATCCSSWQRAGPPDATDARARYRRRGSQGTRSGRAGHRAGSARDTAKGRSGGCRGCDPGTRSGRDRDRRTSAWGRDGRGSRLTERELRRFGIHSYGTPSSDPARGSHPFYEWMRVGFGVFESAGRCGFPRYASGAAKGTADGGLPTRLRGGAVRRAPGAADTQARVPARGAGDPRRGRDRTAVGRPDRRGGARGAHPVGAHHGQRFAPGDPREGVIVLPARTLPPPPYWRATRPPDPDMQPHLPGLSPCACGDPTCSALTASEFAPGHDAKRKSLLWSVARDGDAAVSELRKRGWELPLELR